MLDLLVQHCARWAFTSKTVHHRAFCYAAAYLAPLLHPHAQPLIPSSSQALNIARSAELVLYDRASSVIDYVKADTVVDRLRSVMELFSNAAKEYDGASFPVVEQRTSNRLAFLFSVAAAQLVAPGCTNPAPF